MNRIIFIIYMIDTLVFSGGGSSGITYVGVYKAFLEYKFLQKNKIKQA